MVVPEFQGRGIELIEACQFEFPKGHFMTCNDWRLELRGT